jgi:hypothetical protein
MKINRRTFLEIAAGLALYSCTPGLLRGSAPATPEERTASAKKRFYTPSPRFYLNLDQDFSSVRFDKTLGRPSKWFSEGIHTHLTVVSEGSEREVKRVLLPGLAHSILPDEARAFVIPTDMQPWLYSLDAETLEIESYFELPQGAYAFGGHAAFIPGTNLIAITTNSGKVGKYDRISLREKSTLREVANISSFGFEAHDIRASNDGKRLFVGHYGSLLGSGPYRQFSVKDLDGLMKKKRAYSLSKMTNIYPAAVTVVEISSGKLLDRLSSVDSGAHCHFAVDSEENFYLPHQPSRITNRPDALTHPWFQEGEHGPEHMDEFLPKMRAGFGTSVAYDEKSGEILIPSRWTENLNLLTEKNPDDFRTLDLKPALPGLEKTHGLALHPDGKSYVITGNNWFATYERKTHRLIPERTFPTNFFVHAHTSVSGKGA